MSIFGRYFRKIKTKSVYFRQDLYDKKTLKNCKKLIVFFIPQKEEINGGIMSIFSLCKYSRIINPDAATILCTFPGAATYVKNRLFQNDEKIWRFDQAVAYANPDEIILHIPEFVSGVIYSWFSEEQKSFLKAPNRKLQINILNQNILLMPERKFFKDLFLLTKNITQTTAHDSYANQNTCDQFGIPLHHFSVFIEKKHSPRRTFKQKEKIIVFSPDENCYKEKIEKRIREELKNFKIITVKNLTFKKYLDLISRAFCVISFGEGLDGYFCDPLAVESIGISVYNPDFFPSDDFKNLKNVYSSYEEMAEKLPNDIRNLLNNEDEYNLIIEKHKEILSKLYSFESFLNNLRKFYKKEYSFFPKESVH